MTMRLGLSAVLYITTSLICINHTMLLAQENGALEEVVVTAQRRVQSLQDVPISIDVLSGDLLNREGFRDLQQMSVFVPGLVMQQDDGTRGQDIKMRGIGTSGQNMGMEQSTATFVDGIHYGRGGQISNAFLDVERIEVLKGPQPVFFGQNASSGAINITTRKPGAEWEGYVNGEMGSNSSRMITLAAGGPITDTLGIRFAGIYDSTKGHMRNIWTGEPMPGRENRAGRVTLQWNPTAKLEITASGNYLDRETGGRALAIMYTPGVPNPNDVTNISVPGGGFENFARPVYQSEVKEGEFSRWGIGVVGGFVRPPANVRDVGTGAPAGRLVLDLSSIAADYGFMPGAFSQPWGLYLNMDYEMDNGIILTSLTGYSHDEREDRITNDNNMPFFAFIRTTRIEDMDQISQEFRATSDSGGFIEWMGGVYYQRETNDAVGDQKSAAVSGTFRHILQTVSDYKAEWYSAFASTTFNFLDEKLALDIGLRASEVKKENRAVGYRADWLNANGQVATQQLEVVVGASDIVPTGITAEGEMKNDDINTQIALRWRPTSTTSLYARYADAFKAGGFDFGVANLNANRETYWIFDPENSVSWEAGVKSTFLDSRVMTELSIFTSTFKGLQQSSFSEAVGSNVVANAAKQKVEGIEFSFNMQFSDQLKGVLVGAIMDGKVISFLGAPCGTGESQNGLCTGPGGTIDRSGQDALFTPDWEFTTRLDYWHPFSDIYKFSADISLNMKDDYATSYGLQETRRGTTERLNLGLGFGDMDDTWEVRAWVRNLTQPLQTYNPDGDLTPDGKVLLALSESDFRSVGVQLKYNY